MVLEKINIYRALCLNLYSKIDNGESLVPIFRDLTKTIDNLNHKILNKKLEIYEI